MSQKLVFLTVLTVLLIGLLGVASDLHVGYASPYTDVDVDTAYNMITNGSYPDLVVLDVRTQSEYDDGHIYGAVWIPHTELEARISELAGHEDHEIIVYCRSGIRSVNASETLDSFNFTKVYNMLGGILAWESSGYPVWIATVHNLNTAFNYDTIQAAIDAPQTLYGHTILVDAGIYAENVVVNKSVKLLGEDKSTTIIDSGGTGNVIYITADNVTITGFTARNSGTAQWNSGIRFHDCDNGKVAGNNLQNCDNGIRLMWCNNCLIEGNHIVGMGIDIHYDMVGLSSSYCTINNNTAVNSSNGIRWDYSDHLKIIGNILNNNRGGIAIGNVRDSIIVGNTLNNNTIFGGMFGGVGCHDNTVFHNNFINNTDQVLMAEESGDFEWDNGLEGNYWSNYTGADSNHDGIGDTEHVIDGNNQDNYPLMGMFSSFNTSLRKYVNVISNSTVEDFEYFESNSTIKMYVSNMTANQTVGFCRVCIPKDLIAPPCNVTINDGAIEVLHFNHTIHDNGTHRWIYFAYQHSVHEIVIVPEFPSLLILPLFMLATLLAVIVYKRKYQTRNKKREV